MKKWSILLTLALFALSCNNVEQFRQPIEDLAGQWDTATSAVQAFATNLQTEQASASQLLSQMQVSESTELPDEALSQVEALRNKAQDQLGAMGAIQQRVTDFLAEWSTKGAVLDELKAGLEDGKLNGDVPATLASLNELVGSANTNLGEWTGTLNEAKAGLVSAYEAFQALLPPPAATEAQ